MFTIDFCLLFSSGSLGPRSAQILCAKCTASCWRIECTLSMLTKQFCLFVSIGTQRFSSYGIVMRVDHTIDHHWGITCFLLRKTYELSPFTNRSEFNPLAVRTFQLIWYRPKFRKRRKINPAFLFLWFRSSAPQAFENIILSFLQLRSCPITKHVTYFISLIIFSNSNFIAKIKLSNSLGLKRTCARSGKVISLCIVIFRGFINFQHRPWRSARDQTKNPPSFYSPEIARGYAEKPHRCFSDVWHALSPLSKLLAIFDNNNPNNTFKIIIFRCMYSSEDGFFNDWHLVHLGGLARGIPSSSYRKKQNNLYYFWDI